MEVEKQPTRQEPEKYFRSSEDWNQFFYRKSGWFGGDGIFCVPLDGREAVPATEETESLFIFSDTLIGEVQGDNIEDDGYVMIHNSIGYFKGNKPDKKKMKFYWPKDENGNPKSLFEPKIPEAGEDNYYWLGDGFVNASVDSTLYIFAHRVHDIQGEFFNFEQIGVSLIAIPRGSKPPFEDQRQWDLPLYYPAPDGMGNVVWGGAILVNTKEAGVPNPDGYIYIYGLRGSSMQMVASRVLPENIENFDEWRFWNGSDWVKDKYQAKTITDRVSNEMSMSAMSDGRYIAAYQLGTLTPEVCIQVAKGPVGPFFPRRTVWTSPEVDKDMDYFAYNAKGHPHISPEGKLLISYNLNSFDFFKDVLTDPNLYRPRFIEVDLTEQ